MVSGVHEDDDDDEGGETTFFLRSIGAAVAAAASFDEEEHPRTCRILLWRKEEESWSGQRVLLRGVKVDMPRFEEEPPEGLFLAACSTTK